MAVFSWQDDQGVLAARAKTDGGSRMLDRLAKSVPALGETCETQRASRFQPVARKHPRGWKGKMRADIVQAVTGMHRDDPHVTRSRRWKRRGKKMAPEGAMQQPALWLEEETMRIFRASRCHRKARRPQWKIKQGACQFFAMRWNSAPVPGCGVRAAVVRG